MPKEEWSQNNETFDIDKYFMQDTTEVDLNAAILVITKNQIINDWTA